MVHQHEKIRRKLICLHLEIPHPLYYNDWILIINTILPHTELFNSLSHDLCYWVGMLWSYCQWKYKKKLVTDEHFVAQILVCCEKMIVICIISGFFDSQCPPVHALSTIRIKLKLKSILYCLETSKPRYYAEIKKY